MFSQELNTHRLFKGLAKALTRLRAYAQAGLSLCSSHIPHCWKSHVAAQITLVLLPFQRSIENNDLPFSNDTFIDVIGPTAYRYFFNRSKIDNGKMCDINVACRISATNVKLGQSIVDRYTNHPAFFEMNFYTKPQYKLYFYLERLKPHFYNIECTHVLFVLLVPGQTYSVLK